MNVIIRRERLNYDTAERSCVLLVELSHFAFINADGPALPATLLHRRLFTTIASSRSSLGYHNSVNHKHEFLSTTLPGSRLCDLGLELRPQVRDVHKLRCSHTNLGVLPACSLF